MPYSDNLLQVVPDKSSLTKQQTIEHPIAKTAVSGFNFSLNYLILN